MVRMCHDPVLVLEIRENRWLLQWSMRADYVCSVAGDCVFVMAMVRFDVKNAIGHVSCCCRLFPPSGMVTVCWSTVCRLFVFHSPVVAFVTTSDGTLTVSNTPEATVRGKGARHGAESRARSQWHGRKYNCQDIDMFLMSTVRARPW